jgi:hypothetical protein
LRGIEAIVSQLRAQRADFVNQIGHIDAALIVLGKVNGTHAQVAVRTISAAGRRRIAAAQTARWAKVRGKAKVATQTNDVGIVPSQDSCCAETALGEV